MLRLVVLLVASFAALAAGQRGVDEVLKWQKVQYSSDVPSRILAADNGYIPVNNIPMGAVHYKNRVFVAVARRRWGIPSTLNVVNFSPPFPNTNLLLKPYPNFQLNELRADLQPDENRIVTVYRPRVDRCDRLWFVDTGMMEIPNNFTIVQRPSIWAIDLKTDKPIHRYEIPQKDVDSGYGLTSITLDVDPDNCEKVFVYISDLQTYRMVVYDYQNRKSWRFLHNYFFLNPLEGDYRIQGIPFSWDDGIFSIALGNPDPRTKFRTAYFHALSSNSEFTVSTEVLRNETAAQRHYHGNDFQLLGYRGANSQSSIHAFDADTGVVFFALIQQNAVSCWDSRKPFAPQNMAIVYKNDADIVYPNDLAIDNEGYVWFMTNSIIKLLYTRLNLEEYNFHVWRANINEVIKGTVCDPAVKANVNFVQRFATDGDSDRVTFLEFKDKYGPGGGPYGGWGIGDQKRLNKHN
ncbi:L-dopachrome tautomerase yellow-f2-like [Toxorhynchites rutilus septentrionalis]|uniref:L-dopachrome tautomerase yellow-f2-like n=1 Tax=Toxorhynchites rutilus septentrionalis TaxID=329112 RepID=UPI00247AE12B|nr:L-dopachrome tautomerase yellow-f2-like [Toxorhynchites rutilus septentrionalis]XP_055617287.1 L-dopachrome tautomerase yellow-f2-like [Toxorhynchites rutilus septentrionalis]